MGIKRFGRHRGGILGFFGLCEEGLVGGEKDVGYSVL